MPASAASLTAIQKVYIAYYGRPADPIGLDWWANKLDAVNGNLSTIINAFGTSAEATARFAGQTTSTMINNLYLQMFNRSAEPAGLTWWVQQVNDGKYTVATVMLAVLAGAQGADATAIAGKLASADLYTNAMDTTAEILAYQGTAAADAGRAFLATYGATTATAAQADAAVATMVAGSVPAPVSQTFALTTGVDNIVGGAGDDTINGSIDNTTGAVTSTMTALDSISGGNGTDTFNLNVLNGAGVAGTAVAALPSVTISGVEIANIRSAVGLTADVSKWTGLTSANVTLGTAVALTAATTTDVSISGATGVLSVDGGKDVTVTASTAATNITIGATTVGAGAVTVTQSNQTTGAIAIDGGTAVTVTASKATTGTITVGNGGAATDLPTGAIVVSQSGQITDAGAAGADDVTLGGITVKGGTTVNVTATSGITAAQTTAALTATTNDTVTFGAVNVTGGASTTAVTVTQDKAVTVNNGGVAGKIGVTNSNVTINDVNAASGTLAGKIATVTLNSFATAAIDSSALTTVNLSGTGTALNIGRGNLTAIPTANTLTMNVDSLTAGTITDAEAAADDGFTTLNIVASGTKSTITSLVAVDLKTLSVTGSAAVELTGYTAAALTSVTAGDGGLTMGTATLATGATFTSGAGADSVIIGATTKAISTGAGNDTVTLAAGTTALGAGGSIDAGDGTDTLSMTADNVTTASAGTAFALTIANFERIKLNAAGKGAVIVELANLDAMSYVDIAAAIGQTIAINSMVSGGTVNYTAAVDQTTATTITVTGAVAGPADVINVGVSSNAGRNINTVNVANVETINLLTDDSAATPTGIQHTATIVDAAAKTITVVGDAGIALTQASTAVTLFDASGVTKGNVSWTTAALAAASTITGGAGNDTLNASLAVGAVTLSGGAGDDVLVGGTAADTISGGDGNDILIGGAKADTLTGGAGRDIFAVLTATDSNGVNSDIVTDMVSGTDFLSAGNNAITYVGEAASYGTVLTSLTGLAYQAVMDTSTKTVYIDVNGDAALTAADISINVNVSDLSQTDFAILGTTGVDAIALSSGVDTVYSLGGADVITAVTNTATLGAVSADTFSISTTGMDIINAVATATLNLTAPLGTDVNYVTVTNAAAGAAITKTVLATAVNQFVGLYDYATNLFLSTTTTAAASASTTDVAASMFLYATADGTTANQGIVLIGSVANATMAAGVITIA